MEGAAPTQPEDLVPITGTGALHIHEVIEACGSNNEGHWQANASGYFPLSLPIYSSSFFTPFFLVIRVNSESGEDGNAFILQSKL
ncbi:hypothetical protein ACJZ2D_004482 [Fusarium nematophilum]